MADRRALQTPEPLKAALVGIVAGLVASLVMNQFQAAVTKLAPPSDDDDSEPATETAANRVSQTVSGQSIARADRPAAGNAVHYALGAALGAGYAVAAEYRHEVTTGFGTSFGLSAAALLDEGVVPALGLGAAPWTTPASTHTYPGASHLLFGAVVEAVRRALRPLI